MPITQNIATQTLPSPTIDFLELPTLFDGLKLATLPTQIQNLIAQIDAVLPQTQCGLCGHADGCLPYASSIATQNEPYNKCVPGGQPVTDAIATILDDCLKENSQPSSPNYISITQNQSPNSISPILTAEPSKWQIDPTTQRPVEMRAIIREDDCIGCTKCIPACPVDAIIGSGTQMHTIFTDLCTGCELCLPPCPVDCIELVPLFQTNANAENPILTPSDRLAQQQDLRQRYHAHLRRVEQQVNDKHNAKPVVSMVQAKLDMVTDTAMEISETQAKNTIEQAKLRSQIKKLEKQLAVRADEKKQMELEKLQSQLDKLC